MFGLSYVQGCYYGEEGVVAKRERARRGLEDVAPLSPSRPCSCCSCHCRIWPLPLFSNVPGESGHVSMLMPTCGGERRREVMWMLYSLPAGPPPLRAEQRRVMGKDVKSGLSAERVRAQFPLLTKVKRRIEIAYIQHIYSLTFILESLQ